MPAPAKVRTNWWGKITWQPWQTLISVLMVTSGITEIVTPESVVFGIPRWEALAVAAVYIAGGLFMLVGMWRLWLLVEMVGLVLLLVAITGRTLAALYFDSPRLEGIIVTFLVVAWAAGNQIYQHVRGRVILQVEATRGSD